MTTKDDIRKWLQAGKDQSATHMIVVCDRFDYEDYPVYVAIGDDVRCVEANINAEQMQGVMEIYRLDMSWEQQLSQPRAFNR